MSDYSRISRGLHYLALGQPTIAEAILDLEINTFGRDLSDVTKEHHVFVSGIARSGTTILTRSLYDTGQFSSLTYRDMPFVLAPNYWSKVSKLFSKTMAETERIHGDGIYVSYDSPEALEEVFWRILVGADYIEQSTLALHRVDSVLIHKYRKYVAAIVYRYGAKRYLAKNNNNILRIQSIIEAFPNSVILVPFRNPLQQSISLLNQHKRLLDLQQQEPFITSYMNWLAHHEFGQGHKSFKLTNSSGGDHDPLTVEYWLDQWLTSYSYLLACYNKFSRHIIFVCYEQLCDGSEIVWESLLHKLEISSRRRPDFRLRKSSAQRNCNYSNLVAAQNIYDRLCSLNYVE